MPIDVNGGGDGGNGGAAGGSQTSTGYQLPQLPSLPLNTLLRKNTPPPAAASTSSAPSTGKVPVQSTRPGPFLPNPALSNAAKPFDDTTNLATNAVRREAGPGLVPAAVNRRKKTDTVPSKSITDVSSVAAAMPMPMSVHPNRAGKLTEHQVEERKRQRQRQNQFMRAHQPRARTAAGGGAERGGEMVRWDGIKGPVWA